MDPLSEEESTLELLMLSGIVLYYHYITTGPAVLAACFLRAVLSSHSALLPCTLLAAFIRIAVLHSPDLHLRSVIQVGKLYEHTAPLSRDASSSSWMYRILHLPRIRLGVRQILAAPGSIATSIDGHIRSFVDPSGAHMPLPPFTDLLL